jgi:hypothetical protein
LSESTALANGGVCTLVAAAQHATIDIQNLIRYPFGRVHSDCGSCPISELRTQFSISGESAKQTRQRVDISRGVKEPGLALDENLRRPARHGSHDGQSSGHALDDDLPEGFRDDGRMNERINTGELVKDLDAKAPELDAFLDAQITDKLVELALVVVLAEERGPYQDRDFLTSGKGFRERA